MLFVSLIPILTAAALCFYHYSRTKYRSSLLIALYWLTGALWILFEGFGELLLSEKLYLIGLYWLIPTAFFATIFGDYISRESIDPLKIVVITATSSAVIATSFDSNAITHYYTIYGELGVTWGGNFLIALSIHISLFLSIFAYVFIKIHFKSPTTMRSYSIIIALSVLLPLIGVATAAFHLHYIIPSIYAAFPAISAFMISIFLLKDPRFYYVLPFTALRLSVIETEKGIVLFSHTWNEMAYLADDQLFSGTFQGIVLLLNESIQKGNIREIVLEEAIILLHESENYPVTCLLIATKASRILRESLTNFAHRFYKDFASALSNPSNITQFKLAEVLIDEYFSFIPEYNS